MTVTQTPTVRPVTGRKVLIWLLTFFGVIMAVNAAFVYFALNSWPGLSTNRAYVDGLAYNKTLEAARLQHEKGWKSHLELGADELLRVQFSDKSGALITGLSPVARVIRPTHEGEDRLLSLIETGPGIYTAPVIGLAAGRWKVELRVSEGEEQRFFIVHKLKVE